MQAQVQAQVQVQVQVQVQGGGMLECGSQGRRELARLLKPGDSVVQELRDWGLGRDARLEQRR